MICCSQRQWQEKITESIGSGDRSSFFDPDWLNDRPMKEFRVLFLLSFLSSAGPSTSALAEGQDRGGGHLVESGFKTAISEISQMLTSPLGLKFSSELTFDPKAFRRAAAVANPKCARPDIPEIRDALIGDVKLAMVFKKYPKTIWLLCDANPAEFKKAAQATGLEVDSWDALFKSNSLRAKIFFAHENFRTMDASPLDFLDEDFGLSSSIVNFEDSLQNFLAERMAEMFRDLRNGTEKTCLLKVKTEFRIDWSSKPAAGKKRLAQIVSVSLYLGQANQLTYLTSPHFLSELLKPDSAIEFSQMNDALTAQIIKMDLNHPLIGDLVQLVTSLGCIDKYLK